MSNAFHFSGRLAEAPKRTQHGDTVVTKFVVIRNQYAGRDADDKRREEAVSIQFTAFAGLAETIAKNVRTGDGIEVTARLANNNYTDADNKKQYDYNFIVEDFDFGAPGKETRAILDKRNAGK